MLCCLFEEMQSDSPAVHYFMGIFFSPFYFPLSVLLFSNFPSTTTSELATFTLKMRSNPNPNPGR